MRNEDFGKLLMVAKAVGGGGGGGPTVTVEPLSVSENGTYRAPAGKAYSPVSVNVPQTETEPLSVSANGEYTAPSGKAYSPVRVDVPQTVVEELTIEENGDYTPEAGKAFGPVHVAVPEIEVEPLSVAENGTYTPQTGKAYGPVTVDVPSASGGGSWEDDVVFVDYDGTIVTSYKKADFLSLSSLPENPSHSGLTAQGWNWGLEDSQSYVRKYGKLVLGQSYVTDTGESRVYLNLAGARLSLYLGIRVNGTVTIDWGDGSETEQLSGSSLNRTVFLPHAYASAGSYVIRLKVESGTMGFAGDNTYGSALLRVASGNVDQNAAFLPMIQKIEVGANCQLGDYAFAGLNQLASISIPQGSQAQGRELFKMCARLKAVVIPKGVTSLWYSIVASCFNLESLSLPSGLTGISTILSSSYCKVRIITIPEGVTSIDANAFNYATGLEEIIIPDSVTSIGASAFAECSALRRVYLRTTGVTVTLGTGAFQNCKSLASIARPGRSGGTLPNNAFYSCLSLTQMTLPSDVTTIGGSSFYNCPSLQSITIPANVTAIQGNAFGGCKALGFVKFSAATPPTVAASNVFSNLPTDCKILVPAGSLEAYTTATNYPSASTYTYEEY